METFYAATRLEWRAWLEVNPLASSEIHLVFYKKHTNKPSVQFGDSIEEAICFGWIDSSKRRLDDERVKMVLSPGRGRVREGETEGSQARKCARTQTRPRASCHPTVAKYSTAAPAE